MHERGSVLSGRRISAFVCAFVITLIAAFTLSGCGGSSKPPSVSVTASVTTVDGTDTVTLTATVTNDKGTDGVSWSVSGGGTLSNPTTTSATYTAPAASSTAQTVTVTATSVADSSKTGSVTLTIPAAPAITPPTSTQLTGAVGAAYSLQLTETGGVSPYIWTLTAGTLPTGWTLTSGGLLSGPAPVAGQAGAINLTVKVTDAGTPTALTATLPLTVTIAPAPAITFTGTMPATATYESSAPYVGFATATGGAGALTYSVASGTLPPGFVLMSTANGEVGGTPTSAGTYNFTMKAADAFGDSATQSYQIVVAPATPTLSFAAIPAHTYGDAAFTASASSASSGAVTYSVTSGPATINSSTGLVTITGAGTVLLGASQLATANYTAATASISFTVAAEVPTLSFTAIPTHTFGDAPFAVSATSASSGAVTYSVTSGPATVSGATVTLTGAGTVVLGASQVAAGNYAAATATVSFTVAAEAPTLSFATIPTHTFGDAPFTVSATSASSGAVTYSVTSGPATVSGATVTLTGAGSVVLGASQAANGGFGPATATISFTVNPGTPTLSFAAIPVEMFGNAPITVSATSASSGTVTYSVTSGPATVSGATVTLTGAGTVMLGASQAATANYSAASASTSFIVYPALTINSVALPAGYAGTAYPATTFTATGGSGTYSTWSWSAVSGSTLPAGLSLSAGGTISGTSTNSTSSAVTSNFSVKVTDSAGNTISAQYSLTIEASLTISTTTPLTSGSVGAVYSTTLAATGGTGSYTWTVPSPTDVTCLAARGLSLSSATGVLSSSGASLTTAEVGTCTNFGVQVSDNATPAHTASSTFTVSVSAIAITPSSLPAAITGSYYAQTLSASGGNAPYTFAVTANSSGLTAIGLSLSSSSTTTASLSGTAPSSAVTGPVTFTVKVTDATSATATQQYTINVYAPLALPAASSTVPGSAIYGQGYSGGITVTGGSGSFSWSVSGLPTAGFTSIANGYTFSISATAAPSTSQTVSFMVTVTDTKTTLSASQQYQIVVGPQTPLLLSPVSGSALPAATTGQSYGNNSISLNYGSGSGYAFSVSGSGVTAINSTSCTLPDGLTASSNGNGLSIAGTPNGTTPISLTVSGTDGANDTAGPNTYTLTVNSPGQQVSGQINLNTSCGSGASVPVITVNLYSGSNTSGTPVQTTTTDNSNGDGTGNGSYSFASVPTGSYTIVPSISGPTSLFYPANLSVTVGSTGQTTENFSASLGYTVSGTAGYNAGSGTAQTGQTYLSLQGNCGGSGGQGTSISPAALTSGGAFSIRGVPPGSYTLQAWMDPINLGLKNTIDPSGSSSVTVTNASVTNAAVTMTNPTFTTPTENPTISAIIPNAQGVLIEFSPSKNSNGVEDANGYTVQWSTSPTLGGGGGGAQFACAESGGTCPYHDFNASGDNGVWFLSNAVLASSGYSFSSGQTYYFQARSFDWLAASQHPSGWTDYSTNGTSFAGVTIGTPACTGTCTTVSSSVTIPAGVTIFSGAPLYLGLLQFSNGSGGSPSAIYPTEIANPVNGANDFTVTVPSGSNYAVFGILDQLNIGVIGEVTVTNVRQNVQGNLTISGATQSVPGITLPTANSTATVTTQYQQSTSSSGTSTNYQLNFEVEESNKLPVAVTLTSGPNVIAPVDMSNACQGCGNPQFQYSASIPVGSNTPTPKIGDTYGFTVTYIDGTQETGTTVNGAVTGWNGTSSVVGASDLATGLAPQGTGSNTTPTFTWTYPASASSYTYQFYICCYNNSDIWDIPGNNSKSNGFTSAQIPAASIPWSTTTDPTGASNPPTLPSLAPGTTYNWQIQVQDSNGNAAQSQVNYIP